MKTKHYVTYILGAVLASSLSACGTNNPAFMEISLTDSEYGASVAEGDSSHLPSSSLPSKILAQTIAAQTESVDSIVATADSQVVAPEGTDIEFPSEPQNYPPADEAMATCMQGWPADVAAFTQLYTLVEVKNTNNRVVYSDKSVGEVAHRIDLATKNTNKGIVELLNPQAAYCVRHDGWNANNMTVRIACSARIIELDANLHIAHRLVVERVGCQ